ncbi:MULTISPECIES: xanthine dehydrogenase family protein molybdopterin-binding subunit [Pandoraea]|uniref:xanthine dehydrogenase family protein molybdopterin-binding subunit n=1 Tax=Pandoraea TaxID=93217 RepID=UPI001F5DBDC7|nr:MULTISPECIES: xanthine dehydrogenase family protein molybdopterin-binding subunit [Pandoraea]MCI3204240.1 carbon monoxide dehydrogenase [Pandoraea sp. LA3]MDN4582266.1 carbon monoxide dehydrogenase [Pandoraea capi]
MRQLRFSQYPGVAVGDFAGVSRRGFLKTSAIAAGGLMLEMSLPGLMRTANAQGAAAAPVVPSAFVHIAPDDTVTIQVNRLDFGQGVQTALPMLVAEELDCDWGKVRGELAPAGDAYKDPIFGIQMTGGSGTIAHSWMQYRRIGASARAMLIAAAAQQWKVPADQLRTENGVVLGPNGKRATYGSLAARAQALPVPANVALKDPATFRLLGKPTRRLDAKAKSTGTPMYGMDFKLPNLKVAVVARPPVFGAKVKSFDAKAAKAVKGVRDVLEIPDDRGGTAVAVIADGYWQAKTGRDALKAEWDTSGVEHVDTTQQLAKFKEMAKTPGIVAIDTDVSRLKGAPKTLVAEYSFPYLAHAPMEPLNCTVQLSDKGAEVWTGTQFQTVDQAAMARTLGLKPEQVKLHTLMAGGGFGRRAVPTSDYGVEAAQVAKAWRGAGHREPVKVIWSREDDIHGGYYRPMYVHRAEIGLDAKGNVLAWNHTIVGQSILQGTPFEPMMVKNGVDATSVEGVSGTPYAVPLRLTLHSPKVNVPVLWWRSVGNTHTAFVMETLIDELAKNAGQDPVAYRYSLLGDKHPRHRAALALAVERSGYGKTKLPEGQAWGVAVHESFDSVVAYVVVAEMRNNAPRLVSAVAGVHCNFAVNPLTVAAQVEGAALMGLGTTLPGAAITMKDGEVEQSNFHQYTVARLTDMPEISVHVVSSGDAPTGMGEPGLPPLAPAYANAVAVLTGKRLRALPFDVTSA